jgi:hypothetical protein
LSTSTDAAIDPKAIIISQIFFSLWISTSLGISAGICAMSTLTSINNIRHGLKKTRFIEIIHIINNKIWKKIVFFL